MVQYLINVLTRNFCEIGIYMNNYVCSVREVTAYLDRCDNIKHFSIKYEIEIN